MSKTLKSILYPLMLLSGTVLALQCILLFNTAGPVTLKGIGTISKETILLLLIEVVLLCIALIFFAVLSFRPGFVLDPNKRVSPLLIPLVIGSLCCIEGIASINLSTTIISGINNSFMILIGIQLFCLGIISISSFIAAKDHSYLIKNVPNSCVLMFFILLIPAAFLIN